jgi:alpha-D-xyloside xylohydrolase
VGGFDYPPRAFDEPDQESYPNDAAVYIRWLQFGVFSSHFRAHGKQPREPWEYGEAAEAIAHRYLKLRYRLLPYIYTEAVAASVTGLPMVKPLVLEYQEDPNTENIDLQYLFGSAFLVAPVFTEDRPILVYLPAGEWVDFWTKEVVSGGRWLNVAAPLETLPLWVKGGVILPMGPAMDYVYQKPLDPLTLEIYSPGEKGELIVREEDGLDIPVRYIRNGQVLEVQFGPTPGRVELVLYGVQAERAHYLGKELDLKACPGGQLVALDGRDGGQVIFNLS